MKNENIAAFLGGMLLGGVIALLLAPESGEQTRKNIRNFIDKEIDELKECCTDMTEKVKQKNAQQASAPEKEDGQTEV